MPRDDLEAQIRRVQAGEADAFEAVVRAFGLPIRAWVIARCPPGGDADDVVQKSFVQAFRKIGQYRPGTDFKAWLFTIARFELMAECTRLRRLADYHSRYAMHALAEELQRRVETTGSEEPPKLDYLRQCLSGLDERAQQMLRFRYADDSPLGEIAEQTGRSVGAIKKHLFKLRQKLHDCIERKMAGEEA